MGRRTYVGLQLERGLRLVGLVMGKKILRTHVGLNFTI